MMANSTYPDFNLADDPWILVVMRDGPTCELSIREVFRQAPRISRLTGDIPQQHVLFLRLLEAILYRAYYFANSELKTHPKMLDLWEEIWTAGSFDNAVIDSYLDKYHEGFSLFGDMPFMQVSGLEYLSKTKGYDPVSEMILDVPKPDKYLFSMRHSAGACSLTFSEAARWLLCVQGYDCAGIKTPVAGNTHANKGKTYAPKGRPVGWAGSLGTVFIEGKSLFETLLLNFVMYTEGVGNGDLFGIEGDVPSWELSSTSSGQLEGYIPAGPASLFAVNSRRARLVLDDEGGSVAGFISCYGDIVQPAETSGCETMTTWIENGSQQKKLGLAAPPLMPCVHDCTKSLWRGLGPLLARSSKPGSPDLRAGVIRWVDLLEDEEIEGLPDVLKVHAQGIK